MEGHTLALLENYKNLAELKVLVEGLVAERDALRAELAEAQEQLEFDRTTCHEFINALDKALDGRFWLTEGRGSYAWDDDRYRDEFKDAVVALRAVIDPMRKMAHSLCSRLPTTQAVLKARVDLTARAEKAEAEAAALRTHVERLREKVEQFLNEIRICPCGCEHNEQADGVCLGSMTQRQYFELEAVRATTPAQSLAACKAEALREIANLIMQTTPGRTSQYDDYGSGKEDGRHYAIEQIEGEAERLQTEAANEPQ